MAESRSTQVAMTVFSAILLACATIFLLWPASEVFLIIFAAILFAVFVNALASLLPDWQAVPLIVVRSGVIVILFLLLLSFFWVAGPRFGDQISQLGEQIPRAIERLKELVSGKQWSDWLKNLQLAHLQPDTGQIMAGATGVFSTAFEALVHVGVIIFIGFYFALQPEIYIKGFLHLIPKKYRENANKLLFSLNHALSWWMLGRFTSMAAVGILTSIGLELMGIPLALVLGVIAGLFCFVPYVGPVLSAVPAILVGLLQSPGTALYVLILYAGIQFFEGNFLTPLIQKQAVSLPPAILLTAQLVMGVFYGLVGIFLATPMAVVVIVSIQVLYVHHFLKDQVQLLGEHSPADSR